MDNQSSLFIKVLPYATAFFLAFLFLILGVMRGPAHAATITVCASGCSYTTINAALLNVNNNDTILVGATYDPTTEVFALSPSKIGLTIDCQSVATIGTAGGGQKSVFTGTDMIIRNCNFVNVRLIMATTGVTVSNNTFDSASSFHLTSAHNFSIDGNSGINDMYLNTSCSTGTISNNTFDISTAGFSGGYPILFGFSSNAISIVSNTFHSHYAAFTDSIVAWGNDLRIASNTFDFATNPTGAGVAHRIINAAGGANVNISGNRLLLPFSDAGTTFYGIYVDPTNPARNIAVTVDHNTIVIPKALNGTGTGPIGIRGNSSNSYSATLTVNNNIVMSTSTNSNSIGISLSKGTQAITMNNDYNNFYQITTNLSQSGGAAATLGANTRTTNPYLKIKDTGTGNDLYTAPFSSVLNVNNGEYIGATPGPRRTTINISPAGIIDYDAVDATSTQDAIDNLLTGDTINLVAGTYAGFTVSSTVYATSSIAVTGAGATTVIQGSGSINALMLKGLDSCTVQNVVLQNAASGHAGLVFASTTNCIATSVTSTGNDYGVWFSTPATGNTLSESYVGTSGSFDIVHAGTGTNNLKNVSFDTGATSITGAGTLQIYFKTRALVRDATPTAINGATVYFVDGNNTTTSTLATDASGYTAFSSDRLAAVFTSGSQALTTGGYNPFVVSVDAVAQYAATSTSKTISSRNQEVALYLTIALVTPGAPTIGTIGQNSIQLTLNSGGNTASTEYAIYDTVHNTYVDAGGSDTSQSPVWQTLATWGTVTVSGLACGSNYGFAAVARAGSLESGFSTTSTASTASCGNSGGVVVVVGGGGGGGETPADKGEIPAPDKDKKEPELVTSTPDRDPVPDKEPVKEKDPVPDPEPTPDIEPAPVPPVKKNPVPVAVEPAAAPPPAPTAATVVGGAATVPQTTSSLLLAAIASADPAESFLLHLTIPTSTFRSFKNFSKFVGAVVARPEVKDAAANRVVPTVVVATGIGVLSFISFADILPLLRYLFLQPVMLLGLRRRQGWGQVYNTLNKLPVALATVRLVDAATGRIMGTRVTDPRGRFAFLVRPGEYKLSVTKENLQFPSIVMSKFVDDGRYTDIYHGEKISVVDRDGVVALNVPLDPAGLSARPLRLTVQQLLRKAQVTFSWAGLVITAASAIIAPRWYVIALLLVHIVLLYIFERLAIPPKIKSWGVVADAITKKPIDRAVVRLFSVQFQKLVDTQITDSSGRYYFRAGGNKYYVTYEHPAYARYETELFDLSETEVATITYDVGLKPAAPPSTRLA